MYVKKFDINPGNKVRITAPAQEPFPAGWAEGVVISAVFYDEEGWYIEMNKDRVSSGWQTGYGYFKQREDGVTVELLSDNGDMVVTPKYPDYIMQKVRQRLNLEECDTSKDEEINNMSHGTVLDHVMEWEGIIGYRYTIHDWIKDIYDVDLS